MPQKKYIEVWRIHRFYNRFFGAVENRYFLVQLPVLLYLSVFDYRFCRFEIKSDIYTFFKFFFIFQKIGYRHGYGFIHILVPRNYFFFRPFFLLNNGYVIQYINFELS